ncbi:hypothetical protein GCM10010401_18440 [Rarobacter faecitabidus]|uniref:Membrane protein n=1 Tax=Rarobacter faecitabidus TaxID=13243 RepID=A0A542ZUM4_RARFA|nr:YihY/virulence factor BrkB family protein [Rarobacter faecitabidus]TQL64054.1 membrane protein [Rarobacter faecitabidus]
MRMVDDTIKNVKRLLDWWNATRLGRAIGRYGRAPGGLLSGGVAYSAAFSMFAALVIGYTILARVLSGQEELRDRVIDQIDQYIPGLVDNGDGGVLSPDQLVLSGGTGWATLIAGVVLLWSAIGFMGGLRSAVSTVLDTTSDPINPVLVKVRDLGGFVVLLVALVASAALSIVATSASSWLQGILGSGFASVLVSIAGVLVAVVIDVGIFVYVIRVMGRYKGRRWETLAAGLAVALVVEGLRIAGTQVITGSAEKNALLASFATIITLLLVVNLITMVTLYAAAWLAESPMLVAAEGKGDSVGDEA